MESVLLRYQLNSIQTPTESGWTEVTIDFSTGLPGIFDVGKDIKLRFAAGWVPLREFGEYQSESLVLDSGTQTVPLGSTATTPEFLPRVGCMVLKSGKSIGVIPLVCGSRFRLLEAASKGAVLEVVFRSWKVSANAFLSNQETTASLTLAYRHILAGSSIFEEPKLNKYLSRRLASTERIESFSQRPTITNVGGLI
jgi:hypothetical protein